MTPVEAAARSYFDRVSARDAAGIAGMYAADGVLSLPNGARFAGPAAIEAFYAQLFAAAPPTPTVQAVIVQGARALVELTALRPDGAAGYAADVFTFDARGLIAGLVIYARSAAP
jgi:ketosteroid isomerase-like protein